MAYSTLALVRQLTGLRTTELFRNVQSSTMKTKQSFLAVQSIYMNGTALVNADYTATIPNKIVLDNAPSSSDEFYVVYDVVFSDVDLAVYQADADSMIDAYLAQYYTVPFTTVPPVIQMLAASMTASRVLDALFANTAKKETSALANQYRETSIEVLQKICDGEMTIPGVATLGTNTIIVAGQTTDPVFNPSTTVIGATWEFISGSWTRVNNSDGSANTGGFITGVGATHVFEGDNITRLTNNANYTVEGGDVTFNTLTISTNGTIAGWLTVASFITTEGITFEKKASNPGSVTADTVWKSSSDNNLYHGSTQVMEAGDLITLLSLNSLITSQTEDDSPASGDLVLVYDVSGTTLVKTTISDLVSAAGAGADTTYDFTVPTGGTILRLDPSTGANDDVTLVGGTNVQIVRDSATQLTFTATNTDTHRAIHDSPVDGATTTSISSNWAFDTVKTAVPVSALFTDTKADWTQTTTSHLAYIQNKPTIPSGNAIIDWTADQGATNIDAGNYINTNTQLTEDQVDDFVGGLIVGGTNVTATYNDGAGTLTIDADAISVDALSDVDTTGSEAPSANDVLKWNGTAWVPGQAGNTNEFSFLITSFVDNITSTQEIGTGTWKAAGALTFTAAYQNGPPSSATVQITSGVSAWGSALNMGASAYTGPTNSAATTGYPTPSGSNHGSINFRLTANSLTSNHSVSFGNGVFWGVSTTASGYDEADIEGLANTALRTSLANNSFTTTASAGNYIIYAYPKSEGATASFTDNNTGFPFGMGTPEEVSRTNASGYTEVYNVYRSTNSGLGAVDVKVS